MLRAPLHGDSSTYKSGRRLRRVLCGKFPQHGRLARIVQTEEKYPHLSVLRFLQALQELQQAL